MEKANIYFFWAVNATGFVNIRLNSEWIAAHVDDVIEKYIHPQILPETERR